MGSSPPHNYTQGVFSTCRHRAGQWHSLSSHNQHSPTPCFPKLSPITAPVLFSSDICCHQAQELKGSPEDCKILWHALCHEWRESRTQLICALVLDAVLAAKRFHSTVEERTHPAGCPGYISCIIFPPWHWHKYLLCSPCVFNSFPTLKLPSAESR